MVMQIVGVHHEMTAATTTGGRFKHAAFEETVQCPRPGETQYGFDLVGVQVFLIQAIALEGIPDTGDSS